MMRILFYILLILVIVVGISFAALNSESVTLHYYIGTRQFPLSFLLAFSFIAGIIIGWLLNLTVVLRVKRENFSLRRKLKVGLN